MAKVKVAIYDEDKQYRERFADYLMSYKASEMELSVFSGINYFLDAVNVEKYQLFVLGRGYEELLPSIRAMPIPVLVLSEQDYVRERTGIEDAQVSFTPKYQSMEVITHQMYLMTEARRMDKMLDVADAKMEVIGVFSPVHHEMQMFFSFLYAQKRAKEKKTIYINFMEFSGLEDFLGKREYDIGDVILQLRDSACRPEAILSYIYEYEGVFFISPFQNPENVKEITGKDVALLLQFLVDYTDYKRVVLDFGGIMREFPKALECCTKMFCIGKRGNYFKHREEEFLKFVQSTLDETFIERIKTLCLPNYGQAIVGGEDFFEQLKWSEFGDLIKEV